LKSYETLLPVVGHVVLQLSPIIQIVPADIAVVEAYGKTEEVDVVAVK
jgi:hypothetical protein